MSHRSCTLPGDYEATRYGTVHWLVLDHIGANLSRPRFGLLPLHGYPGMMRLENTLIQYLKIVERLNKDFTT
jgi:hypothetical protein